MTGLRVADAPLAERLRRGVARRLGAWGVFAREFARHPVMVGSVIPSSPTTVERMLEPVDWARCDVFVEYGPGVGTFCHEVLRRMKPGAALVVIDTNAAFVDYLAKAIRDSRFYPVHGSAADVRAILAELGHGHADYILSGLPFSTLPGDLGPRIAAETAAALRPGGGFLVYQFVRAARRYMAPHFDRIDHGFNVWNILPCHLFWGWKADDRRRPAPPEDPAR